MKIIFTALKASAIPLGFILIAVMFIFLQTDDDEIIVDAFLTQQPSTITYTAQKISYTAQTTKAKQSTQVTQVSSEKGEANLLEGNSIEAKCWNYFVKADIPGLSDNPAVIAGILGNFQAESTFNPWATNSSGYFGIFQLHSGHLDIKNKITDEVGDYWGKGTSASEEATDKALSMQLDYLLNVYSPSRSGKGFFNLLDVPQSRTGENGAMAYAELFLAIEEGAIHIKGGKRHSGSALGKDCSVCDSITDPGVQNKLNTYFTSNICWQHAERRRQFAQEIFRKFAMNNGAIS